MSGRRPRRHPVARGFDRVAQQYERGRPGYPSAAVAAAARLLRAAPGRTIVELGSGTGKLTRALRAFGPAIVAVEPSAAMRAVFEGVVPGILTLEGVAEAIPLPDRSADGVVAAQSFHWFRPLAARKEIARVLRPGGTLVLLWNVRDEQEPINRELDAIVDRWTRPRPRLWKRWERAFAGPGGPFGPLRRRVFPHPRTTTVREVVQHLLSVSRVAVLSPGKRGSIAREIREALAARGWSRPGERFPLPTVTEVYWARRTERGPPRRRSARTRRTPGISRHSVRRGRRTAARRVA